jgi:putative hydrolase of the HAD superfamily
MKQTEVVLFDLGGVLIQLGGVRDFGDLIGEPEDARVWARWLACPWVRDYERGRCSTEEFATGMVESYELQLSPQAFLERFRSWPQGFFEGASELVAELATRSPVACLSNTNALHWEHQRHASDLARLFPTRFLSHQLDMIKPDREIYEHVVRELDCASTSVCFLDDNQLNVDAARELGIDAHCVAGPQQARAVLRSLGLLA